MGGLQLAAQRPNDQRELACVPPLFFDVQLHCAAHPVVERRIRVRGHLFVDLAAG